MSRLMASAIAMIAGAMAWLSAGTVAVTGGGADRVAAIPPLTFLLLAIVAAAAVAYAIRLRVHEAWPVAISLLLCLPFVPGQVPAIFLVWQGPIETVVWSAVLTGVIVTRLGRAPHLMRNPQLAPWLVFGVVAIAAVLLFVRARDVVPGGDEPHYLAATQSLIADHDLKVANNYAQGDYLAYFGGRLQPHFLRRSAGGEIYSIHSPGVSVVVLPAFAMAGYLGAVATVILIAAITASLTWATVHRLTGSVSAAWVGVLAVYSSAPLLLHTFTIYPDAIGGLMVMGAVWLIIRVRDESIVLPIWRLVVVGAGLATLPWLHTRFAILAAVLGIVVIARLRGRSAAARNVAAFLAVPVIAAATWFGYFWVIWGTPNPMAPYGADTNSSVDFIVRGLTGLLIDQQFGVLATAPAYAAAFIGVVPLWRQDRRFATELAVLVGVYVMAVSTYAMWWGGTSAPARFVAAILPLASIGVACAWEEWPRARAAILALMLVSASLLIFRSFAEGGRFIFTSRSTFDPTLEWLAASVDLAAAMPSVHRDGLAAWRDALPWLVALAAVWCSAWIARARGAGTAATWTIVIMSGALAIMLSATSVWAFRDAAPLTPQRSMLASLAAYRPWHRTLAGEQFLHHLTLDVPASGNAALLRAARVPAGEYAIVTASAPEEGRVTAIVNRNDPPLESAPSNVPFRLRLPVGVVSLSVRADTATADGQTAMQVRPLEVDSSARAISRHAVRAARYGRARVFVFDERAYLEPKGFWTRAEGRATVVIDGDEDARTRGLPLAITAGAAATTIGISVDRWAQSYSLTPGQRQLITLPPLDAGAAWLVNIHSGPGFRPFLRDPASTDVRALAAWFEFP